MGAIQRLNKYVEYKGISKYKFYKKTGLSNGFLDKGENIGTDKCEIISYAFPDINIVWLVTGSGNMLIEENISNNCETLLSNTSSTNNKYECIDYKEKYLDTLEKLIKTKDKLEIVQDKLVLSQELLIKSQNEVKELMKELEILKDQGGKDIVVGA